MKPTLFLTFLFMAGLVVALMVTLQQLHDTRESLKEAEYNLASGAFICQPSKLPISPYDHRY